MLASASASAGSSDPLGVKLSNCEPTPDLGSLGGLLDPGYGNLPEHRKLWFHFGLHVADAGDSVAGAIANTDKIEVCELLPSGALDCPGTDEWIFYQKGHATKGTIDNTHLVGTAPPSLKALAASFSLRGVPVDWGTLTGGSRVLTVRVSPSTGSGIDIAKTNGFCVNWWKLATGSDIAVYGVLPPNSFLNDFGLDPCTDGAAINWTGAGPPLAGGNRRNVCTSPFSAEWLRQVMVAEAESHRERIQRALPVSSQVDTMFNGVVNGVLQPYHVWAGPHRGAAGQSSLGAFWINVDDLNQFDPLVAPNALGARARALLRLASHEFFHGFQGAWMRRYPTTTVHINHFSEELTSSVELNLCMQTFPFMNLLPGTDPRKNECISVGKLGASSSGRFKHTPLLNPELDAIYQPYDSALFWGYVQEQYAWPLEVAPHPTGTASGIQRPQDAEKIALALRPHSDEGMDLIGRMYADFALPFMVNAPAPLPSPIPMYGSSTSKHLDRALTVHLGRKLPHLVRDYHAAMVLKDYSDPDPRWRFEWFHRDGLFASTVLQRPFTVPDDLNGGTPDGLVRARRVLDSWQVGQGGGPATRVPLSFGDGISSAQPLGIGLRGAAVLSVSPDSSFHGKKVYFQADVVSGDPLPSFRVFRVNQTLDSPPKLVPEAMCAAFHDNVCKLIELSDGRRWLGVPVIIYPETREVIVIASATSKPANFNWSFGVIDPRLDIIEPTESLPASIGSASSRTKALLKLSRRDGNNQPIASQLLDPSDVTISLTNPSGTGGGCTLSSQDFALWPLSGGHTFVVVSPPVSCYPPAGGPHVLLDLSVTIDGQTAVQPRAVRVNSTSRGNAVVVALDESAPMAGFALDWAKDIAKALFRSLVTPPGTLTLTQGALVRFNTDATTLFPVTPISPDAIPLIDAVIDGISASGQTSIGDGLFESQFLLANKFDPVAGTFLQPEQTILVLSQGRNTADAHPRQYYSHSSPPSGDGNGPWAPNLSRNLRKNAGLPLPILSAVALGNDADASELARLARVGNGTLLFVGQSPTPAASKLRLSDAIFQAAARGLGHQRVGSAAAAAGDVVELWVEPGARELRVNVVGVESEMGFASLFSPDGSAVEPLVVSESGASTSFRLPDPASGRWRVWLDSPAGSEPATALVEGTVEGPLRAFVTLDAADATLLDLEDDDAPTRGLDAFVGSTLLLRSATAGDALLDRCAVSATLTLPDGVHVDLELRDEGETEDAAAGDGIFGAAFARTSLPGPYVARVRSRCVLDSGDEVRREELLAVVLAPLPDTDEAGVPARWKEHHGLTDPLGDADGDGLPDAAEFAWGTNPLDSDSDGGGESDASEIEAGRDPHDPDDDRIHTPDLIATPGDGLVYFEPGISGADVTLVAERAASREGVFLPVAIEQLPGPTAAHRGVANDVRQCYRLRVEAPGATSGWSNVACATPRLDPIAPRVELATTSGRTHSRDVELDVRVDDPSFPRDSVTPATSLDAVQSGVEAIRVWFGPDEPDGIAWQPVSDRLELRLPDGEGTLVRVQARDEAGNVSSAASIVFSKPLATPVARAIAAEERAEDLLDLGRWQEARAEIAASLVWIDESFTASVLRLAKSPGQPATEKHILTTLAKVRAHKLAALALMKPPTVALARSRLEAALALEIALATFAHERDIPL